MSWFNILKINNITHFHGTNKEGIAQTIMESGIVPQLEYKAYKNGGKIVLAKHPIKNEENGKVEEIPELAGKYSWAAKEPPLGYSGWYREHKPTYKETYDDKGRISMTGRPTLNEWKEGGLFGIEGSDIEWLEVYSACYRMNTPHYVTKETILPNKIKWMPIDDWEKWYDKHDPDLWASCSLEMLGKDKWLTTEEYNRATDRNTWRQ